MFFDGRDVKISRFVLMTFWLCTTLRSLPAHKSHSRPSSAGAEWSTHFSSFVSLSSSLSSLWATRWYWKESLSLLSASAAASASLSLGAGLHCTCRQWQDHLPHSVTAGVATPPARGPECLRWEWLSLRSPPQELRQQWLQSSTSARTTVLCPLPPPIYICEYVLHHSSFPHFNST